MRPDVASYRFVHFATHSALDWRRPELSGVVLSLVGPDGARQDGLLRLHEIVDLRLQADLVVPSACDTALGPEVRGEGVAGLARGFMRTRARRGWWPACGRCPMPPPRRQCSGCTAASSIRD